MSVPNSKASTGPCDCRKKIDEQLKPHNTRLSFSYVLDSPYVGIPWVVGTVQIENGRGKQKAMSVFASYCPFCGMNWRQPTPDGPLP